MSATDYRNWVYEDEIYLTDEKYDAVFPHSRVIDGVRMFPSDLVHLIENGDVCPVCGTDHFGFWNPKPEDGWVSYAEEVS